MLRCLQSMKNNDNCVSKIILKYFYFFNTLYIYIYIYMCVCVCVCVCVCFFSIYLSN